MKVYVIAIKIKYIDKTLEFGNPLEVSESKEDPMARYNQDGFGFKVATAVTKTFGHINKPC